MKKLLFFLPYLFLPMLCFAAPPVKVGVLTELSGPYAAVGSDCISGFDIALTALRADKTSGSSRLELIYEDTKSDPTSAVSAFHRLSSDPEILAYFTTFTKIALPLNPLSKELQVVLLATSGHPALLKNNPYAFRFFPSAKAEGLALAAQAVTLGKKRAALLTLQEEWNEALAAEFKERFTEHAAVVYEASVPPAENDFAGYIVPLRASRPDLLFVNLTFGQIGVAVKKIRNLGLEQQIFSNYRMQYKETYASAGPEALEGAVFFETNVEAHPRFLELLAKKAPNAAASVSFVCYTALASLIQVLNQHPLVQRRDELYQALLGTADVALLDDKIKIAGREAQYQLVPRVIKQGLPRLLDPSSKVEP